MVGLDLPALSGGEREHSSVGDDSKPTSMQRSASNRLSGSSRLLVSALSLAAACSLATPAYAAPPAAAAERLRPVELLIDVQSGDEDQGQRISDDISDEVEDALEEAGYEIVTGGAEARIEAHVELADPSLRNWLVDVEVIASGSRRYIVEQEECAACSEQNVRAKVLASLPAVIEYLPKDLTLPPCLPGQGEGKGEVRLGPIGFSGALTAAGGLGLVFTGIGVYSVGKSYQNSPGIERLESPSPLVAGPALIGVGAALALGGVAALLVDLKVLAPRRAKVQLSGGVSREGAGVLISGRF